MAKVANGTFAYRPASLDEGSVVARFGAMEHRTAVNAILPGETAAEPIEGEPAPGPDRSGNLDTKRELWPWLVLAAAALLLLHWALRRFAS